MAFAGKATLNIRLITSPTVADSAPIVGRERELTAMRRLYKEIGPDGSFLVVAGEAGVGKSRLAVAFLSSVPRAARLEGALLRRRREPGLRSLPRGAP